MKIVGLMSGTSLDGIDLALCDFPPHGYSLLAATTRPYSPQWVSRLTHLEEASAFDYALADVELGHLFGCEVRRFLDECGLQADAVASHGHTIFHRPDLGLTTQIGNLDAIAAECRLPVVGSFRTLDVALGGEGAPLVPIGDELLFPSFDACLNLGGIANISFRNPQGIRLAFDICPCNMALNRLAARLGLGYDPDGTHASQGTPCAPLGHALDALPFYTQQGPKSLGKEWFLAHFWPLIEASPLAPADLLRTVCDHIAHQVALALQGRNIRTLLITGGGAFNRFLVSRIADCCKGVEVEVPEADIVNYKEAIVFALLGHLRLNGQHNTLASVTGASADTTSGNLSGLPPAIK